MAHPYTVQSIAAAFIDNVIKLHGPPIAIVSDRDKIFTSKLWKEIFEAMKVDLRYSSAYHPQSDGQTERVDQCIELSKVHGFCRTKEMGTLLTSFH